MAQLQRKFVTVENLDTEHFVLDQASKKIKLNDGDLVKKLKFENTTKNVTWTDGSGEHTVSLAEFLTDVHVTGATLEGTVLTLAQDEGHSVRVDLAALAKPVFSETAGNVRVTGAGTAADPFVLTADQAKLTAGNGILIEGNEVKLDESKLQVLTDAFGTELGRVYGMDGAAPAAAGVPGAAPAGSPESVAAAMVSAAMAATSGQPAGGQPAAAEGGSPAA